MKAHWRPRLDQCSCTHRSCVFGESKVLLLSICVRGLGPHKRILQFGNSPGEKEIIMLLLFNHEQVLR